MDFTVFNTAPGIEPILIRYGLIPGAVSELVRRRSRGRKKRRRREKRRRRGMQGQIW